MNCPNCKSELAEDAVFCPECGTQIEGASDEAEKAADSQIEEKSEEVKDTKDLKKEDSKPEGEKAEESKEEVKEEIKEEVKEEVKEEIKEEAKDSSESSQEPVAAEAPVAVAAAVPAGPTPEELKRQKQEVKRQKKEAKKLIKEERKAKIAELPKEYKPLSTLKMFGFILLTAIPVIGFIALLIFAFACKNRNIKSVARAILVYMLIFLIISVVFTIVSFILIGGLFADILGDLTYADSVEEVLYILDDLVNAY